MRRLLLRRCYLLLSGVLLLGGQLAKLHAARGAAVEPGEVGPHATALQLAQAIVQAQEVALSRYLAAGMRVESVKEENTGTPALISQADVQITQEVLRQHGFFHRLARLYQTQLSLHSLQQWHQALQSGVGQLFSRAQFEVIFAAYAEVLWHIPVFFADTPLAAPAPSASDVQRARTLLLELNDEVGTLMQEQAMALLMAQTLTSSQLQELTSWMAMPAAQDIVAFAHSEAIYYFLQQELMDNDFIYDELREALHLTHAASLRQGMLLPSF